MERNEPLPLPGCHRINHLSRSPVLTARPLAQSTRSEHAQCKEAPGQLPAPKNQITPRQPTHANTSKPTQPSQLTLPSSRHPPHKPRATGRFNPRLHAIDSGESPRSRLTAPDHLQPYCFFFSNRAAYVGAGLKEEIDT